MNTNRISKTIAAALNNQITKEAWASQLYLSYAAWVGRIGYNGISVYLLRHAEEERNHMTKILEYVIKRGSEVHITAIEAPPKNPESLYQCVESIFQHEVENTKSIYKIVKMSFEEEDWATWNFLQWFVKEQVEEETFALSLLDKFRISDGEKPGHNLLYSIDRELGETFTDPKPATDATAANP